MRASFSKFFTAIFLMFAAPLTAWANTTTLSSYLPEGCYHAGEYQQHKTLAGMDKPLITDGSFVFNCHSSYFSDAVLFAIPSAIRTSFSISPLF